MIRLTRFILIYLLKKLSNLHFCLFDAITEAPSDSVLEGLLFGVFFGIGGIMFWKSIPYIGISLTYGIVIRFCSAAEYVVCVKVAIFRVLDGIFSNASLLVSSR